LQLVLGCIISFAGMGYVMRTPDGATWNPGDTLPDALGALLSPRPGAAVCWLGNDGWLIGWRGALIAFDLDLRSRSRLWPSPLSEAQIGPHLRALFITHEHGDHFNAATAKALIRESRCRFVIPQSCLARARSIGLPPARIVIAHPGEPFGLEGVRVRPLRAIHGDRGTAVYRHANLDDCGYVLSLGRLRVAQLGDSVLTQEHLSLRSIDVLFVSPTEHNLAVLPAKRLLQAIRPRHVFPQHYGTYRPTAQNRFWTVGYVKELREALTEPLRSRFQTLRPGEVCEIRRAAR